METNKLFIETYGCQMNTYDSEVVLSILQKSGYTICEGIEEADLILINTCSIRDNVSSKSSSVSPGKPTITSVDTDTPGTAFLTRAKSRAYSSLS